MTHCWQCYYIFFETSEARLIINLNTVQQNDNAEDDQEMIIKSKTENEYDGNTAVQAVIFNGSYLCVIPTPSSDCMKEGQWPNVSVHQQP